MDVYQIISLVISILTLCGFGYIAKNFWTDRREARKTRTDEAKAKARLEMQNQIKAVVEEAIQPLKKDLKFITEEMKINKDSTVTSLRSNMKELRDKYKAQGYADVGDKAIWNELYKDYRDMGGNHFKEYVDQWREEVNSLPTDLLEETK